MSDVVSFLQKMTQAFDPSAASGTNCVLQFNTSKPAYITIKDGAAALSEGSSPSPDVTLIMADEDLIASLTGDANHRSSPFREPVGGDEDCLRCHPAPGRMPQRVLGRP